MLPPLQKAEKQIAEFFDQENQHVFTRRELESILDRFGWRWHLPAEIGFVEFQKSLEDRGLLRRLELKSESYPGFKRFIWREASPYEVALTLRKGSYLSHSTAVFLHGLTDQLPELVYLNKEQSPKPSTRTALTQEGIDRAFSRPQRKASYIVKAPDVRVILLNGKYTDRLEVGRLEGPRGEALEVTKLERTLVDIVVWPVYAGGVYQILETYRAAKERLSLGLLLSTLKKLDHAYPYHQAIGFYMEQAGYDEALLRRVERLGLEFDFHLAHGLRKTVYVPRWRLHCPEGF